MHQIDEASWVLALTSPGEGGLATSRVAGSQRRAPIGCRRA
jgi:hypothetical protein